MALWGFAEQIKSTFVLFRIGLRARQNVHAQYQNVQLTHLYQPDIVHTQTLHCLGLSDSLKFLNRLEMDHLSTLLCNFDSIGCSKIFGISQTWLQLGIEFAILFISWCIGSRQVIINVDNQDLTLFIQNVLHLCDEVRLQVWESMTSCMSSYNDYVIRNSVNF